MKKMFSILLCLSFCLGYVSAQVPQAFKYQAIMRNPNNNDLVIANQAVSLRISILQGSASGTVAYSETFSITSNEFGLVNLEIGKGTPLFGSFSAIDWSTGSYYLKTEVDPAGGTTYQTMGTAQLLSVPFAMFAQAGNQGPQGPQGPAGTSLTNRGNWVAGTYNPGEYVTSRSTANATVNATWFLKGTTAYSSTFLPYLYPSKWTELAGLPGPQGPAGTTSWTDGTGKVTTMKQVGIGTKSPGGTVAVQGINGISSDSALFEVKDKNGLTVFAVYEDGAVLYVKEGTKGGRGGFAVGGRKPAKGYEMEDILRVTPDSVRIYINDTAVHKGGRGGFAVGGRKPTKGTLINEYFRVTPDSVRVYINDDYTKGGRGGFAVGGRKPTKGPVNEYLRVTPDSTRVYVHELKGKGGRGGFAVGGRNPDKGTQSEYFNISNDLIAQVLNPSKARILWYPKREAFLTGRVLVESPDSVGTNSMATGFESKAIGNWSQALGYRAIARRDYSTAIGKNAVAISTNCFSLGDGSKSLNSDSYAFGAGAIAQGKGSYAFGSAGRDTSGALTGTMTIASGNYSFAIGQGSSATNTLAFALGSNVIASGQSSIAMGYYTKARGIESTAMGIGTTASGLQSTAMGAGNIASGASSTAMGGGNSASGDGSTAMGSSTTASGAISTAMGFHTTAIPFGSLAIGRYNDQSCSATGQTQWISTDPLFIAGNGSKFIYGNALTLYKNGNLTIAGTLTQNSDFRLKENITSISNGSALIERINPVYFYFKDKDTHPAGRQIGIIAQEVKEVIPELVQEDGKGFLSVDYSKMSVILLQALKEQKQQISTQQKQIENLQNQVNELKELVEKSADRK